MSSPPGLASLPPALGRKLESFRPSVVNLMAGLTMGVLLIGGGLVFDYFMFDTRADTAVGFLVKWGIFLLLPLSGVALLVWMKRLGGHFVFICENGLAYVYRGNTDTCLWSEAAEVRELFTQESFRVLKVPGATIKRWVRGLVICRSDGKEFHFTVNSIGELDRLVERISDVARKHGIPWNILQRT